MIAWEARKPLISFIGNTGFPWVHAAATTPAQRLNVSLRSFHPDVSVFADRVVGSACPLSFRGLLSVHSRCGLHTRAVTNS